MYWHQGCVNTATVFIETDGAKVRIHICEGANTHFKKNSSCVFPVFAQVRTQAPHVFVQRLSEKPRAHKNKIGTSPPPPKPKIPPPPKRGILWTWFFLQNGSIFPGAHKIGAAISGPRIADTNFTDTRVFLRILSAPKILLN